MVREKHEGANTVILSYLRLTAPVSHPGIFVDAVYVGRVPTTEDTAGLTYDYNNNNNI